MGYCANFSQKVLRGIKEQLTQAVELINCRPRKRLGYKTPVEVLASLGFKVR
jgi:IS30 family transposase